MMTASHHSRSSTLILAGLAAVATIGIGCWFSGTFDDEDRIAHGTITIVAGPDHGASYRTTSGVPSDEAQAATPIAPEPPQRMPGLIVRQYPQLKDVAFECVADACRLAGSLIPPTSDYERQQRQEMLLGGLERLLADHDHPITAPIQMDENGDDEFRIRVATR